MMSQRSLTYFKGWIYSNKKATFEISHTELKKECTYSSNFSCSIRRTFKGLQLFKGSSGMLIAGKPHFKVIHEVLRVMAQSTSLVSFKAY